jgi:hypothetical protein
MIISLNIECVVFIISKRFTVCPLALPGGEGPFSWDTNNDLLCV